MPHIAILSSSVRTGRNSHRVTLYFKHYLESNNLATVEILDLKEYNFPIFDERLKYQKNPNAAMLDFAGKIKSAACPSLAIKLFEFQPVANPKMFWGRIVNHVLF